MPNIASVHKDEILRLVRKEVRKELEGLKRASGQYRSDIAGPKRQVATLNKQVARVGRTGPKKAAVEADGKASTKFRFSAKRSCIGNSKAPFWRVPTSVIDAERESEDPARSSLVPSWA
jgi:hypothetical protein